MNSCSSHHEWVHPNINYSQGFTQRGIWWPWQPFYTLGFPNMTSVQMGRGGVKKCTQFADKYRLGFEVKEGGGLIKIPKFCGRGHHIWQKFSTTSRRPLPPFYCRQYSFITASPAENNVIRNERLSRPSAMALLQSAELYFHFRRIWGSSQGMSAKPKECLWSEWALHCEAQESQTLS